ncbi:MAG: FecR family protein [Chromatiales bacterium]
MHLRPLALAVLSMACLTPVGGVAEPAGNVIYAYGETQVLDVAGRGRAARRGEAVAAGQTLATRDGRMQVRFADGGFIAIQPNTRFRIDEYRYAGREDGSERSFFNLVRGGIRFVTGAIGHRNKENYQIRTAVATIGIRGSAGLVVMCVAGSCAGQRDGAYVTGHQDTLTLTNETGITEVAVGETFHTECSTCAHNEVEQGPDAYAAVVATEEAGEEEEGSEEAGATEEGAAEEEAASTEEGLAEEVITAETITTEFYAGDQRDDSGGLEVIDEPPPPTPPPPTPPPSGGAGHAIGFAYVEDTGSAAPLPKSHVAAYSRDDPGTQLTLDANNIPLSGSAPVADGTDPAASFAFDTSGATIAESGGNAALDVFWVRWSTGWQVDLNGSPVSPLGHAHAIYTTSPIIVSVPATGTATFGTLIGGTQPTMNQAGSGMTEVGSHSVLLTVDFGQNNVLASVSGSFPISGISYFASGTGLLDATSPQFGHFDLMGSCSGGGGICGTANSLIGGSEFALVGSGSPAAAAGVYDLRDPNGLVTFTGTYLVAP